MKVRMVLVVVALVAAGCSEGFLGASKSTASSTSIVQEISGEALRAYEAYQYEQSRVRCLRDNAVAEKYAIPEGQRNCEADSVNFLAASAAVLRATPICAVLAQQDDSVGQQALLISHFERQANRIRSVLQESLATNGPALSEEVEKEFERLYREEAYIIVRDAVVYLCPQYSTHLSVIEPS